ncbi:MAG: hypothetical protein ACRD5F_07500 [Candidatus Acidiferrales bacterium]
MALAGTGALEGWPDPAGKPVGTQADAPAGATPAAGAQPRHRTEARGGASQLASDEQLMLAHQQGTADAFPELFARYRQPI